MADAEQADTPPEEEQPDEAVLDAAVGEMEAAGAEERPRKKKKRKRKKRREPEEEPELRPARDAQGRDRPAFLLAFPHDPELEPLIEAFEAGDYATVRREAPELAERTDDPEVRDAAQELRRRIDPDPLARYLLLTGVGLLLFLIIWVYVKQGH